MRTIALSNTLSQLDHELRLKVDALNPHIRMRIMTPPLQSKGHAELFRDACAMHRAGFSEVEQEQVLRARYSAYYREIPDREYQQAIANAANRSHSRTSTLAWPPVNDELVFTLSKGEKNMEWLRLNSPVKEAGSLSPGEVIDRL